MRLHNHLIVQRNTASNRWKTATHSSRCRKFLMIIVLSTLFEFEYQVLTQICILPSTPPEWALNLTFSIYLEEFYFGVESICEQHYFNIR